MICKHAHEGSAQMGTGAAAFKFTSRFNSVKRMPVTQHATEFENE